MFGWFCTSSQAELLLRRTHTHPYLWLETQHQTKMLCKLHINPFGMIYLPANASYLRLSLVNNHSKLFCVYMHNFYHNRTTKTVLSAWAFFLCSAGKYILSHSIKRKNNTLRPKEAVEQHVDSVFVTWHDSQCYSFYTLELNTLQFVFASLLSRVHVRLTFTFICSRCMNKPLRCLWFLLKLG